MISDQEYQRARIVALQLLSTVEAPPRDLIRRKVETAFEACEVDAEESDVNRLCIDIETSLNVWVGAISVLDVKEDHIDWLSDTMSVISEDRPQIKWDFWKRYERFLQEVRLWPPNVLRSMDRTTTAILKRLEDPKREGKWDRRGMVVGSVQSGKTSNYIGLISKAVDAGYKLIFVLTGLHNNLRSQTQFRLDDEFLGYDTDKNLKFDEGNIRMGVGRLSGERLLRIHSLTSSNDKGDFNQRVARQVGVMPGGDPILLVVKKNVSVLRNLNGWARSILAGDDGLIRGVPLLVIDDECDQASINTKPLELNAPDYDVTKINAEIRNLLKAFEKCAYVGYTATPFASIFIHPSNPHTRFGEDIFPESFIISLPTPSNYIGPLEVFGIDRDDELGFELRESMPVLRPVIDNETLIPDSHDKLWSVRELPGSLKEAILSFILSCAARSARGEQRVHNSMLIHVSKYVSVQNQMYDLVTEELKSIQRRVRYGDGDSSDSITDKLKQLWETDFIPTTSKVNPSLMRTWEEIQTEIETASSKIIIRTINGSTNDILDYRRHASEGVSVIAIGGDKLSRGLTLEGLTTSYYLRATRMYDTLLQMGRWFGYKDTYIDLCRIYTTPELISWYRWIAMASEELRRDFIHMESIGATPNDFGLRVRQHPGGLLITSINKMRSGTRMKLSYSNTMNETLVFHRDPSVVKSNFQTTDRFVSHLGEPTRADNNNVYAYSPGHIWDDVSADDVIGFLSAFVMHPDARRAKTELLVRYIRSQVEQGDLTKWCVSLLSRESGDKGREAVIGGLTISCFVRKLEQDLIFQDKVGLKRIVAPKHEASDLTKEEYGAALEYTIEAWRKATAGGAGKAPVAKEQPDIPSPTSIRLHRPRTRGLLLIYPIDPDASCWDHYAEPVIGLAISFPSNPDARAIDYVVNKVYEDEYL